MTARLLPGVSVIAAAVAAALVVPLAAREDWVIDRFDAQLTLQRDGSIAALEAVDADFRASPHHGIYRDITSLLNYDGAHLRKYEITLGGVTSADGRRLQVATSTEGTYTRFRIGDPKVTMTGKATYRIAYRIRGALNAFADHDELYWNAIGNWEVPLEAVSVLVVAPADGIDRATCFQGPRASTEPCDARFTGTQARFRATRALRPGEQLTIVTSLRKGIVAPPEPMLVARSRDAAHFFDTTPSMLAFAGAALTAVLAGLGALWWRVGRDRRFVSMHYLSQDTAEQRVPMFASDPVVVEFEPPEKIRPGQMGLLLDERADTLDVTATIIDLAVRGYLTIKELPKTGWFGHTDWQLDQLKPSDANLLDYERIVLDGLFSGGSPRTLSDLKNKFYSDLSKAKAALYADAVGRRWFPMNPNVVRGLSVALGVLMTFGGGLLVALLGARWGAGLVAVPVVFGGVLLAILSNAMPRRSALGREMMRRSLGFARYMTTAEVQQQAFAERANIFTSYLPYAIVLKCVDKWARAFKDIDLQAATAGWYVGSTAFNPTSFTSSVGSFSTSVSSAIASTPGGSGSSGFSGGSSGGGGGGGGGGGW
jgi:uncharacterized membrane protein YgcG